MVDMTSKGGATGQVWAHVGQPFEETYFDLVVVGAGRMGAACALYLRQLLPHQSLLLVEEAGLPNEEGATILAPGVWTSRNLPPAQQAQANWTRQQLAEAFGKIAFAPRLFAEFHQRALEGAQASTAFMGDFPELAGVIDPAHLPFVQLDMQAATYRPGFLALSAAQQAIRLGANLLLNTRATPLPHGLKLERLTVTNTHQIVTHETHTIQANTIILATGASGPSLAEHHLGRHTRHGRSYLQYPHLGWPSQQQTPVLQVRHLLLRPQHGAFTLVMAPQHPDPFGYRPTAGHLTGVPTGLRREMLEELVTLLDAVPALTSQQLQVGHSLSDIAGAWVALPNGQPAGFPLWQALGDGSYLLLGGPQADTLGLSTAYDLCANIANVQARPWR